MGFIRVDLMAMGDARRAEEMLRGTQRLFESFFDMLDADERLDLKVGLLLLEIGLDWDRRNPESHDRAAAEVMQLTENPQTARQASQRIAAMTKVYRHQWSDRALRADSWRIIK